MTNTKKKSASVKSADPTAAVMQWIARSYESYRLRRERGREVYLACNGDSGLARMRVAAEIRQAAASAGPQPEGGEERPSLPLLEGAPTDATLPTGSRLLYVDWVLVADYILLACREPFSALTQENTRRKEEYRRLWESYLRRRWVVAARKSMRSDPGRSAEEILAALKAKHPRITKANVLEAQRQERAGVPLRKPLKPSRPRLLRPYSPVYFTDVDPSGAAGSAESRDRSSP
ncbi:MAG: hypothetical protein GYA33_12485 [Thermogutta sp.]|nr:hypothetical protein [Thermogutta sp.]